MMEEKNRIKKLRPFPVVFLACVFLLMGLLPAPSLEGAVLDRGIRTNLFHSYDGLVCSYCHTIHYSEGGTTPINADAGGPFQKLLTKRSTSDLCLGCHTNSAAQIFGAPMVMTADGSDPALKNRAMPGGDFFFSRVDPGNGHNPSWTNGQQSAILGQDMVLAASFPPDAPGLNIAWTEENWDCVTCHGPHDRFGADIAAWRQLKRKINDVVHTGDETASLGVELDGGNQGPTTPGYEPIVSNSRGYINGTSFYLGRADSDPNDGANLFAPEGETNKNVYRSGFSSFCSVCHGDFHGGTETSTAGGDPTSSTGNTANGTGPHWLRHPTNVALDGTKYNVAKYTVTVVNSKGTNPNPEGYDWKYPLARVNGIWTVDSLSAAGQVTSTDKVMCLSCHKAHASQYANALRWDNVNQTAFIADGEIDGYFQASNGDNPAYGCNKCHQKGGATAYTKAF